MDVSNRILRYASMLFRFRFCAEPRFLMALSPSVGNGSERIIERVAREGEKRESVNYGLPIYRILIGLVQVSTTTSSNAMYGKTIRLLISSHKIKSRFGHIHYADHLSNFPRSLLFRACSVPMKRSPTLPKSRPDTMRIAMQPLAFPFSDS